MLVVGCQHWDTLAVSYGWCRVALHTSATCNNQRFTAALRFTDFLVQFLKSVSLRDCEKEFRCSIYSFKICISFLNENNETFIRVNIVLNIID